MLYVYLLESLLFMDFDLRKLKDFVKEKFMIVYA